MKKQHSILAWLANTPPMLLLALFVLFSPVQSWADVTADWGEWSSGNTLPSSSSSTVNQVTLSSSVDLSYLGWGWDAYCYNVGNEGYFDITVPSGYVIKEVRTSTMYDSENRFKIKFCSSSTFDESAVIGETTTLSGNGYSSWTAWGAGSAVTLDSENPVVPDGAKSARISNEGSASGSGSYLYYVRVTIESTGCASQETASFLKVIAVTAAALVPFSSTSI